MIPPSWNQLQSDCWHGSMLINLTLTFSRTKWFAPECAKLLNWFANKRKCVAFCDANNLIFITALMSHEVITQRASAAIFKVMDTTYWGHELDLARSHDIIDRMTFQLIICYFLLCPTGTESLSSTVFDIFASKCIGQWPWRSRVRDVKGHVPIRYPR